MGSTGLFGTYAWAKTPFNSVFSGSHEENMVHVCKRNKQQSEEEVAFKVNAGGRTSECKINCFNTSGVLILLFVHRLSRMGAIIDFRTGAAFFRHLADQAFVQLEREPNGHLYVTCGRQCFHNQF